MKKINLYLCVLTTLVFTACQKEIDWSVAPPAGTDGDLLIRVLQVTPSTHDTNIITFDRDANKRLIEYESAGKVNGIATDILHTITRAADGKILKIKSSSTLTAGLLDSTVYFPHYTGSKMDYVIDTQYTLFGIVRDSIAYSYDGSGKVVAKETQSDFIGGMSPSSKQLYEYDASGNVITITDQVPDGFGGYDDDATTDINYDGHKNAIVLGEESYIILGASNTSPLNPVKQVSNAVSSGTTYTTTFSNATFNSFNRPRTADLKVTPVPPGYQMKLTYFYQ